MNEHQEQEQNKEKYKSIKNIDHWSIWNHNMNSIKTFEQKKKLNSWNGMEWNWFIEVKWTSFSIINVSTFLVLLFYFCFSLVLLLFVFSILFCSWEMLAPFNCLLLWAGQLVVCVKSDQL